MTGLAAVQQLAPATREAIETICDLLESAGRMFSADLLRRLLTERDALRDEVARLRDEAQGRRAPRVPEFFDATPESVIAWSSKSPTHWVAATMARAA